MRVTLFIGVVLAGCGGDKDGTTIQPPPDTETGTPPVTDTGEPPRPGADLVVTDDANFALTQDFRVDAVEVRSSWDVVVSWDSLTTDVWGEPISPIALDTWALLEVLSPAEELADRLERDDLGNDLISTWTAPTGGDVFGQLSALSGGGSPFDPVPFLVQNPDKSWLVALGYQVEDDLDVRALLTLVPEDLAGATQAEVTDLSSDFGFTAALDGVPLVTAEGWELYTVAWDQLTTDALGKPYDKDLGDELFVGRFDGGAPDPAVVLHWSELADAWYTMDVDREDDARLDLARDAGGVVFPGFTAGSTWVMGVRCTTCLNPLPMWVVTVDVSS
jgi:hypothetical protein